MSGLTGIGLFPIPEKRPVFSRTFTGTCPDWKPVLDRSVDPNVPFAGRFQIDLEPDETAADGTTDADLDPCQVFVSQVSIHLRRRGHLLPSNIYLVLTPVTEGLVGVHTSAAIPALDIDARPEWYYFDFSNNPFEISTEINTYDITLGLDTDYRYPRGVNGIQNEDVERHYG